MWSGLIFLVLCCIVSSESVRLPSNFKKCNRKDAEWKACVFEAGVDGLRQLTKPFPEVNIPSLNPFLIPEISLELGSSSINLKQTFRNCKIYGLTEVKPVKFEFDFEGRNIWIEGTFIELNIDAIFQIEGKILLLPLLGNGVGQMKIKNLYIKDILPFEEIAKNGKTYIKVLNSTLQMTPERFTFKTEDNLFKGDEVLSANILKAINDNWKDLYDEVGYTYTEVVSKIFVNLLNNFFSKVSVEEAFD